MRTKTKWSPGPGIKVLGVALTDDDSWVVSAAGPAFGICPDCGRRTRNRHGWSNRSLQDLPAQGKTVTVKLRLSRWRCAHQKCERQTFTDRLPTIASPYARRTRRVSEIFGLLGHSAGGRPGERLMRRLGMPDSDDTILRQLKRDAALVSCDATIRVVAVEIVSRARCRLYIAKWLTFETPPDRQKSALKPTSPLYFEAISALHGQFLESRAASR